MVASTHLPKRMKFKKDGKDSVKTNTVRRNLKQFSRF
jgi:hypothetical protein